MLKKVLSLTLAALMLLCCIPFAAAAEKEPGFGDYEHVFIIGVDGAGAAWEKTDTPNVDRIFRNNALRYNCHSEYVTVSAQNWGSILCGVPYDVHGFTNGSIEENERTSDSANNSIYYYVRKAMPDAELVSFCNWAPINHGIIENDLGVKKIHRATDPLVTQQIVTYFNAGNKPALMFVQLDEVDGAGHSYGGFDDRYYAAVTKADRQVGEIYDAIEANGLMENGLFIVVADHGETTTGHGGQTVEESSVIVACAGKSVNNITIGEDTQNRDVAAIALHALGIDIPEHMTAKVPEGLFGEITEKETEKADVDFFTRIFRAFLNFWVRFANFFASIFD